MFDVFKLLLRRPCLPPRGPCRVPVHLQLLQPGQLGLQHQAEAGGEEDPGDGQPAGEAEQEEPQEEEAAEDQTEGLEEGERPGGELGGGEGGELEGRVGVELLQGGLLVSPALLQPFLQPNVGVRQRAQRVTDKVKVDLQKQRKQRSQQGLQNRGQG